MRLFFASRRPDEDVRGTLAYAEHGVEAWQPRECDGVGKLWRMVPDEDRGEWTMVEVKP
jgi:hypothetical protein